MARGRLKGALQDALDPNLDADSSNENIPVKIEKYVNFLPVTLVNIYKRWPALGEDYCFFL